MTVFIFRYEKFEASRSYCHRWALHHHKSVLNGGKGPSNVSYEYFCFMVSDKFSQHFRLLFITDPFYAKPEDIVYFGLRNRIHFLSTRICV